MRRILEFSSELGGSVTARAAGWLAAVALTAGGCGPTAVGPGDDGDDTGDDDGDDTGDDGGDDTGPPPAPTAVVYAHSSDALYSIDPDTLAVRRIGAFDWPGGDDEMTDLAVDRDGGIIGISFDSVYAVDPATAAATRLAALDGGFTGLTYVPVGVLDDAAEVLVAADESGGLYRVDPATGDATAIGSYGEFGSSGDLVSVDGFGTVATVIDLDREGEDILARVDFALDGRATPVADQPTGIDDLFGLGFWGGTVFGFAAGGEIVTLDVTTGRATVIDTGGVAWAGAGVTTAAPIVIE